MNRRELELLAALAEGRLEDESEARALMESSPEHLAEYEAQKAAVEALRSAPAAELTEHERAALRRDVWAALKPAPAPAAPRARRWAPAAALVLVVGSAVILNRAVVNTTGEFVMMSAQSDTADEPTATTAAAALESLAESGPVTETGADEASKRLPESASEDPLVTFLSERASRLREGDWRTSESAQQEFPAGRDDPSLSETHAPCVSRAALEVDKTTDLTGYEAIDLVTEEETLQAGLDPAKAYLVAVPAAMAVEEGTPVAFIELETCVLTHLER